MTVPSGKVQSSELWERAAPEHQVVCSRMLEVTCTLLYLFAREPASSLLRAGFPSSFNAADRCTLIIIKHRVDQSLQEEETGAMEGLTGNFASSFDHEKHKTSPCASPLGYSWNRLQQSGHQPVSDLSTSRLLLLQLALPHIHLQHFFLLLTLLFPIGTVSLARAMMVDVLCLIVRSSVFK